MNIKSIIEQKSNLTNEDIVLHYSTELEIPMLLTIGRWKVKHKSLNRTQEVITTKASLYVGMGYNKIMLNGPSTRAQIGKLFISSGKELPTNLDIPILPLKNIHPMLIGPKHQITRENYIKYLKSNIKKR